MKAITADDLVLLLDAAGIKRAAVFSVAYIFGGPARTIENEYEKVKAENDWASQQVARFAVSAASIRSRTTCSRN